MELNESLLGFFIGASTGFIGFASLINTFTENSDPQKSFRLKKGLQFLISHSLAALFLSLLLLVLHQYHDLMPTLSKLAIRITSGMAVFFFVTQLRWIAKDFAIAKYKLAIKTTFIPPTLFLLGLQFSNAVFLNKIEHLYPCLFWLLLASAIQFLLFILPEE